MKRLTIVVLMGILTSGCAGGLSNETGGAVVGGVLGGALGTQVGGGSGRTAAIIGGTLLGAYLGSRVGKSMDRTDQLYLNQTLENNNVRQSRSWQNPDTRNNYTVTPTKTYYQNNSPCRDYTVKAMIDGKRENVIGTACRDESGHWVTQ